MPPSISELVLVIAKSSIDSTLTVQRGIEATTAASHSYGAPVINVITREGLHQLVAGTFPPANYDPNDFGTWSWANSGSGGAVTEGTGLISLHVPSGQTHSAHQIAREAAFSGGGFEAGFRTVSASLSNLCGVGWQDGTGKVFSIEAYGDQTGYNLTVECHEQPD